MGFDKGRDFADQKAGVGGTGREPSVGLADCHWDVSMGSEPRTARDSQLHHKMSMQASPVM